mmetsp:Transcript_12873/g.25166  ORF Transcript_12873/g.25166 Transcript_12873/m.25166 type:complete len:232 (+) Transcript_12873:54-749(+)
MGAPSRPQVRNVGPCGSGHAVSSIAWVPQRSVLHSDLRQRPHFVRLLRRRGDSLNVGAAQPSLSHYRGPDPLPLQVSLRRGGDCDPAQRRGVQSAAQHHVEAGGVAGGVPDAVVVHCDGGGERDGVRGVRVKPDALHRRVLGHDRAAALLLRAVHPRHHGVRHCRGRHLCGPRGLDALPRAGRGGVRHAEPRDHGQQPPRAPQVRLAALARLRLLRRHARRDGLRDLVQLH